MNTHLKPDPDIETRVRDIAALIGIDIDAEESRIEVKTYPDISVEYMSHVWTRDPDTGVVAIETVEIILCSSRSEDESQVFLDLAISRLLAGHRYVVENKEKLPEWEQRDGFPRDGFPPNAVIAEAQDAILENLHYQVDRSAYGDREILQLWKDGSVVYRRK